jgi:hypothetical protein
MLQARDEDVNNKRVGYLAPVVDFTNLKEWIERFTMAREWQNNISHEVNIVIVVRGRLDTKEAGVSENGGRLPR